MSLADLAALYLLAGLGCAVGVWVRRRSVAGALVTLVIWPLWAPFALLDGERRGRDREPGESTPEAAGPLDRRARGTAERIADVLRDAEAAAAGTPFAATLSRGAVARIATEVDRVTGRLADLDRVLCQREFARDDLIERLAALERDGASEATVRTARLHLASVDKLSVLRRRHATTLAELEQMLVALRGQLVVARYAGSIEHGVDDIVADLWARIEGLGEVLETSEAPAPQASRDGPLIESEGS